MLYSLLIKLFITHVTFYWKHRDSNVDHMPEIVIDKNRHSVVEVIQLQANNVCLIIAIMYIVSLYEAFLFF